MPNRNTSLTKWLNLLWVEYNLQPRHGLSFSRNIYYKRLCLQKTHKWFLPEWQCCIATKRSDSDYWSAVCTFSLFTVCVCVFVLPSLSLKTKCIRWIWISLCSNVKPWPLFSSKLKMNLNAYKKTRIPIMLWTSVIFMSKSLVCRDHSILYSDKTVTHMSQGQI